MDSYEEQDQSYKYLSQLPLEFYQDVKTAEYFYMRRADALEAQGYVEQAAHMRAHFGMTYRGTIVIKSVPTYLTVLRDDIESYRARYKDWSKTNRELKSALKQSKIAKRDAIIQLKKQWDEYLYSIGQELEDNERARPYT